jgi:thioredoxin reductase
MSERVKIAVVGAGPGGISAAAHAAELGVTHVLLEATDKHADTIQKYQKGKHVMAEPNVLPLRSPVGFEAGTREAILGEWENGLSRTNTKVRYRGRVENIQGAKGDFTLTLSSGDTVLAEHVILGIGVQGNPNRLG